MQEEYGKITSFWRSRIRSRSRGELVCSPTCRWQQQQQQQWRLDWIGSQQPLLCQKFFFQICEFIKKKKNRISGTGGLRKVAYKWMKEMSSIGLGHHWYVCQWRCRWWLSIRSKADQIKGLRLILWSPTALGNISSLSYINGRGAVDQEQSYNFKHQIQMTVFVVFIGIWLRQQLWTDFLDSR